MQKAFAIALKDLRLAFRDPAALLMMLATPFAVTIVIGLAFGGFGGGSAGLRDIQVIVADQDGGELGRAFVTAFQAPELADLLAPTITEDADAARAAVDADDVAAAVIVPPGLTAAVMAAGPAQQRQVSVEVYANPAQAVSAGVARAIADQVAGRISGIAAGTRVSLEQLIANGLLTPQDAAAAAPEVGARTAQRMLGARLVSLRSQAPEGGDAAAGFDFMAYYAPSMAIIFLMFTVTAGGRSILAEREAGTLPRMLVTPSTATEVLGGKVMGIFLLGLAQMAILLLAATLLLGVDLGPVTAVAPLTVAMVLAATGWGMLMAAYARTHAQAGAMGPAISLTFAALAGNFIARPMLPQWLRTVSYVTPNAWGLDGFIALGYGGGLAQVAGHIAALLLMAAVLFVLATVMFRRRYAR